MTITNRVVTQAALDDINTHVHLCRTRKVHAGQYLCMAHMQSLVYDPIRRRRTTSSNAKDASTRAPAAADGQSCEEGDAANEVGGGTVPMNGPTMATASSTTAAGQGDGGRGGGSGAGGAAGAVAIVEAPSAAAISTDSCVAQAAPAAPAAKAPAVEATSVDDHIKQPSCRRKRKAPDTGAVTASSESVDTSLNGRALATQLLAKRDAHVLDKPLDRRAVAPPAVAKPDPPVQAPPAALLHGLSQIAKKLRRHLVERAEYGQSWPRRVDLELDGVHSRYSNRVLCVDHNTVL